MIHKPPTIWTLNRRTGYPWSTSISLFFFFSRPTYPLSDIRWNDGSTLGDPSSSSSSTDQPSEPLEPFLLAGDPDLEEDTSLSTPPSLYLRPYSRVHLADKWQILGVPNLVVYHLESRKVLSYHARFELLREGKLLSTWEKWSKGEKITFGVNG